MISPPLAPSSISLPLRGKPVNDANMDALPLELKQRICSFLTPKDLKPLRLTSRIFTTAAERYFINRFFLFNYPDSILALSEIVEHEVFSKYLTAIVCDTSMLKVYPSYEDCWPAPPPPSWDDYCPETLLLNDTESYAPTTEQVMQRAQHEYQVAYEDWEAKTRNKEARRNWYQAVVYKNPGEAHHLRVTSTLRKAFERCPRLRNLVLSSDHPSTVEQRRFDMLGMDAHGIHDMPCWFGYLIKISGSLSQLNSLTLLYTGFEGLPADQSDLALPNLKHLRINNLSSTLSYGNELTNCALILRGAKSLETLSLAIPEHNITDIVESLRSDYLRVCLLRFRRIQGNTLVDVLLRHAPSLQRLGLSHGSAFDGWLPVFRNIAGRLPALRRVQLQCLKENSHANINMTPETALKAGRFVVLGGSVPVLQFKRGYGGADFWSKSDQEIDDDGSQQNELSPGLWQDYESMAVEGWDGYSWLQAYEDRALGTAITQRRSNGRTSEEDLAR